MMTLQAILLGFLGGGAFAWALRGTGGRRRALMALSAGLPVLVVLTAFALWHDRFPATFGPFVVVCFLIAAAERGKRVE